MKTVIRPRSFEEWIVAIFDHPVPTDRMDAWYWRTEVELVEPTSASRVNYLTRLLEQGIEVLRGFSDDQVAQGISYLLNSIGDDGFYELVDSEVDLSARKRCVNAIPTFFASFVVSHVDGVTSYSCMNEPCGDSLLEVECFMWWDTCFLSFEFMEPELADTCLDAMQQTLTIEHMACQRSALHGLGHWHEDSPQRVKEIIDLFIANNPKMNPDLLAYAQAARTGRIL